MRINHRLNYYVVLSMLICTGLLGCSKKGNSQVEKPDEVERPLNPIFQADPTIFYHEGTYYLYGTNDKNADNGFLVYSSIDGMKNWSLTGYALRKGDAFGESRFWAPHVWTHNGKFYMAYTADEKIAIAESNKPTGPFTQTVKTALVSSYGQIDPYVFIDDDGKKYLYHVRLGGGNKVWVAELTDDFSAMKAGTHTECITATAGTWEHVNAAAGRVAEGPTVIKREGKYYLFYSANDYRHKDYAVGYAESSNVYGPWTRYTGNPVVHQSITGHAGSGHGDVVKAEDGTLYYIFHAHNTSALVVPRKSAIIKLTTKSVGGSLVFGADKESFRFLNLK